MTREQEISAAFEAALLTHYQSSLAGIERRTCPDQFVGFFGQTGYIATHGSKNFEVRENVADQNWDQPPIIVVLESPHVQEFRAAMPGPAQGTTGRHIRLFLGDALRSLNLTGLHPLILMNAIQHQCSTGVATRHFRDKVFTAMWAEQCVKKDFERRLGEYAAEGALVINACTKGAEKLKIKLFELVEETISCSVGRPSDLSIKHPAGWLAKEKKGSRVFRRIG